MALSACGSPDGGLRGGIPPAPDPTNGNGIQHVPTNNLIPDVTDILYAMGFLDTCLDSPLYDDVVRHLRNNNGDTAAAAVAYAAERIHILLAEEGYDIGDEDEEELRSELMDTKDIQSIIDAFVAREEEESSPGDDGSSDSEKYESGSSSESSEFDDSSDDGGDEDDSSTCMTADQGPMLAIPHLLSLMIVL